MADTPASSSTSKGREYQYRLPAAGEEMDPYLMLSTLAAMAGMVMKYRIASIACLFLCATSFANGRKRDYDYKQFIIAIAFGAMGLYSSIVAELMQPVAPTVPDAGLAAAAAAAAAASPAASVNPSASEFD